MSMALESATAHSADAGGERRDAGEEDGSTTEEVAEAAAEEEEAAEGDQVGVDDPGEVGLAHVQVGLDGREGHGDDGRVEHDHELREADDCERQPAPAIVPKVGDDGGHLDSHGSSDHLECKDDHHRGNVLVTE